MHCMLPVLCGKKITFCCLCSSVLRSLLTLACSIVSKSVTIAPLFAAAAMASPGKSLSQRDAAMALDNVRQAIHSEGVEWTETSNGNRFATIPAGTTPAKRFLDLPAGLGSFFDIGEVMGRDVDVACYHMGYWMDTSIIKDNAATICADLVAQTALGQAADGSWNVVKRLGVLPEDKNADLNFMW